MALRYLARRARITAVAAASLHRPPVPGPRVMSPLAARFRPLSTKDWHNNGDKFQRVLTWKGPKISEKEAEEQVAKLKRLFGEDFTISENLFDEMMVAIFKAARTAISWFGAFLCIVLAVAIYEGATGQEVFPNNPKKDDVEPIKMENEHLQRENTAFRGIEHVVRALAVQGGLDYDALVQQAESKLATSKSEAARSREHDCSRKDGLQPDCNVAATPEIDEETRATIKSLRYFCAKTGKDK